jgi:uracil-DNA glycosylase family 4
MPDSLEQIAAEVTACRKCPLGSIRKNAVPGEGPADARIMFIGEGPGFHEDLQGRPFVGASGQYLEELLAEINLTRRQVYIANVIKCRPPGNRDPEPSELAACRDYLDRQIALIKPSVIVTLGRYSMERYFPGQSISRIHGRPKRVGDVYYLPMFHPAAAQPCLAQRDERRHGAHSGAAGRDRCRTCAGRAAIRGRERRRLRAVEPVLSGSGGVS